MKKSLIPLFLVLCGCTVDNSPLKHAGWEPFVEESLNSLIMEYKDSDNAYVVFDFDNTTAIFDIEEQLGIWQLETMSFAMNPDQLDTMLLAGLSSDEVDYRAWASDICSAYSRLYRKYGPFTYKGLDPETAGTVRSDPDWLEFATKFTAMTDLVSENELDSIYWAWALYWASGMTFGEVYDMTCRSNAHFMAQETSSTSLTSPEIAGTKLGRVSTVRTTGVSVTDNLRELWKAFSDNGIDVWVCSASGLPQVLAAVDSFGLREWCSGVMAMSAATNEQGCYIPEYDFETGYAYIPSEDGGWKSIGRATRAITGGPGKVTAIENVLVPTYGGKGPIAGFMDSSGDFNFCTEFSSLRLVCCFNRANRKPEEGGGLIAEVAVYEKDVLGYDLKGAGEAGDILYVLQGRDENGMRSLRPSRQTVRFGETQERLFDSSANQAQLDSFISQGLSVKSILETYSRSFLDNYSGYRSR